MEFSCVCSFPSVCVCSVCTVLYVFTERTCVCVCHVCVCVCVMVGRPSQAHELAMIHAGAYSMFIHRTMCVCLRVCKCVCIFTMTHNAVFLSPENKGEVKLVWSSTAGVAGHPAGPVALGHTRRTFHICLISLTMCLIIYWLMMFPE